MTYLKEEYRLGINKKLYVAHITYIFKTKKKKK